MASKTPERLEMEAPMRGLETPASQRRTSDPLKRLKTIGYVGSIALVTNNITGPGMICAWPWLCVRGLLGAFPLRPPVTSPARHA